MMYGWVEDREMQLDCLDEEGALQVWYDCARGTLTGDANSQAVVWLKTPEPTKTKNENMKECTMVMMQ